jgi:hypothetical protein
MLFNFYNSMHFLNLFFQIITRVIIGFLDYYETIQE